MDSQAQTLLDVRLFQAPVVRLFQTALGRDPDANELARASARLRQEACLHDIAEQLSQSDEFIARLPAVAGQGCGTDARLAGAFVDAATRADLLVALSQSARARRTVALLPGVMAHPAPDDPAAYRVWIDEYDSPPAACWADLPALDAGRVVLAMVVGDTTTEAALISAASLGAQNYPHWSLRIVANRLLSGWSRAALAELAAADARIAVIDAGAPLARAAALQRGFAGQDGAYAAVLDPGDRLPPTALYEVMAAFLADPAARMVFTDEDVLDGGGRRLPRFKPAYSPAAAGRDLLGALAVYRLDLFVEAAARQPAGVPQEDDALADRAAALAGAAGVRHLPAVLYHRAAPPAPPAAATAATPETTLPASPATRPDVTVIVATRDRAQLLAACTEGVLRHTDYPELELLVVDNDSTEPAALALLDQLRGQPRVSVLRQPGAFNFAALNNAAAAHATGEVLLLLNNDIEILHPEWLSRMVAHAVRPDVGAVGAKLLYPDGSVQHAGILLGPDGSATHVGRHAPGDAAGYLGRFAGARDLSAVTGACLAIRRAVYHAVGGMDERLAVTWNDIDLCLRVGAAGLRVIWTPEARLMHREAASRGTEAGDPAKQRRFLDEQALMRTVWGERLTRDRYLNANLLASEAGALQLTRPRHRRPWQSEAAPDIAPDWSAPLAGGPMTTTGSASGARPCG